MSRRPFDPRELDRPADGADESLAELERFVTSTATDAPSGFTERVMNAVAEEPAPRRRRAAIRARRSPGGDAGAGLRRCPLRRGAGESGARLRQRRDAHPFADAVGHRVGGADAEPEHRGHATDISGRHHGWQPDAWLHRRLAAGHAG